MFCSDVEMPGSSKPDSEPDTPGQVCVPPDVAAACKRGSERISFKGKQYVWKATRTTSAPLQSLPSSVVGNEYEKVGSGYRRNAGAGGSVRRLIRDHRGIRGLVELVGQWTNSSA